MLADAEAVAGRPERAALLLGACSGQEERSTYASLEVDKRLRETLASSLGAGEFSRLLAKGAAQPLDVLLGDAATRR